MPFADAFTRAYNAEAARLQSAQQHEAGLQLSREQMEQGKKIAEARLKQEELELAIRKLQLQKDPLRAITTTDPGGAAVQKFLPESQLAGQSFPLPAAGESPVDISGLMGLIQAVDPNAAKGLPTAVSPKAVPILTAGLSQLGQNKRDANNPPAAEPLVTVNTVDDAGNPVTQYLPRGEVAGKSFKRAAAAKPPTEGERRAFTFYTRAKDAESTIEQLEPAIAKLGTVGQARLAMAPNLLQSEQGQLYTQARRQFTEARLRKDSGAAISASEYERDAQTYFAQPGDTPAVLKRKQVARKVVLAALQKESGRAYEDTFGTPPDKSGELNVDGYVVRPKK